MNITYDECKIYKDILIEKFFAIKSNNQIGKLTNLKDEAEYLVHYLNMSGHSSSDLLELQDLLLIIKFVIKLKYIKNTCDVKDIRYARNVIKDLWRKLIKLKNENKHWSIVEVRYMNIMLTFYTNIDGLIEISKYTKSQMKNYYRKNEISYEDYNTFLIDLKTNLVITLFAFKFNPKFKNRINDNKKYEDKKDLYDNILNNNINEILEENIPNKYNVKNLIHASCIKATLSKESKYIKYASMLIKYYKLYYIIDDIKLYIIKYENDKKLRELHTDLIVLGNTE